MSEDERARRAAEQEQRALDALESILRGGDLGQETLALSNEFTDRHTARFTDFFRRRPRRSEPPTDVVDSSGAADSRDAPGFDDPAER